MGISEVLHHGRKIYGAWRKIKGYLQGNRPNLLILIDFPDFNFLLARLAKGLGIPVLYFISPQVWAWRSGRVRTLKRFVDEMAVILPFEQEFFQRFGMTVHFVGHPLLDRIEEAPSRDEAASRYGLGKNGFLVGLLPGSRQSEIRSLLPELLAAAALIRDGVPDVSFVLPVAPTVAVAEVESRVAQSGVPVQVVAGDTYGVLRACDLVLTASGTVTLESAMLGTPMVIVYKVSSLSYHLGRHLIKVKYAGLPNLIAGQRIVPECLQHEARAERIAAEAMDLLLHPQKLEKQKRGLAQIRQRLGAPGVAHRVAELALAMCSK
ncbi:lipid-A-disaccharide synthase [Desulforhabdus sp. TSK]|nr:lipid-A-disaccharide synthase [Desulforhabdus sp. TSK]